MISIEIVIGRLPGLSRQELERWISNHWVRPDDQDGDYFFHEIDVARVRLIQELRDDFEVNEEAVPVILSLIDQLYLQRRRMRDLCIGLHRTAPEDVRQTLVRHLTQGRI